MEWKLFADLAEAAGAKRVTLDLEGDATVGDAVDALLAEYPALADRVVDEDGALVDHVNVLRNGQNVFAVGDGLETPLERGDELAMFPPVSGGSGAGG